MDIVIRSAIPGDIPGMCDLLGDLFSIERDFTPDRVKQVQGLSSLVADPSGRSRVFVAQRNGTVVGMVTVQTLVSTAEGGRVGLVEDLVVDSRFRSQGTGRRLLEEVIAWGGKEGLKRLQLLADRANAPALRFYHRAGWTKTGMTCIRKLL